VIYVIITFAALLFLNIYSSSVSRELFYNNKEASMIERCRLAASEIADLEALNASTVARAVADFEDLNVSRLIITDQNGRAIFDTYSANSLSGKYTLFPEIIKAMDGNDVFYWNYHNGIMRSTAATPIYSYEMLIGCVYMVEFDQNQGTLFSTLQQSILTVTLGLEIVVILYSLVFSNIYSRRLNHIMISIRKVRQGDYTHKLSMRGHDELNTLSDEFNDLIDRLQISEQKRSRFVSDASHELRTPLASIKLLSDSILQNDMDVETIREFVADIGNEADRLSRMTQKLLALSRIDSRYEDEMEIIPVCPTVDRVVRMLSVLAADSDIKIQKDCRKDAPILIVEDDLYQILFNLIENGIKYNRPGGSLSIDLDHQDEFLRIRIADTGVGIPEESLKHIFERFYRVDKARSRSTGGSGLGLSIVKNIVEKHNGSIFVTSKIGEGTEFTILFPIFDTEEGQS